MSRILISAFAVFLGLSLGLLPDAGGAAAAEPGAARRVVVRGGRSLADALAAATKSAWEDAAATRPVAIVVDVTPYTQAAAGELRAAFEALGDRVNHLNGSWRIGPLGGKLGKATRHPSRLPLEVPAVLAKETDEVSTIRALSRSLADFDDRGGCILYLADWRFEDDDGLEELLARIESRGQTFTVIGSEAAFGRPWIDPFGIGVLRDPAHPYVDGVGRAPFGKNPPDAPWHGGDTAYPHLPWLFSGMRFETAFPLPLSFREPEQKGGPENLARRIRRLRQEAEGFSYPLASSWGPYSLMRLAAETGGNYYLHSFNPRGRTDLTYDYARCNQFPPDLRSRREILDDARTNPLPVALARAWEAVAASDCRIAKITGPLLPGGAPQALAWNQAESLPLSWLVPEHHRRFLRLAPRWIARADEAIGILEGAIRAVPAPPDPWARYRADAELFLHTLVTIRFELGEALAAAQKVGPDAWDDKESFPALVPVVWLPEGSKPEDVEPIPGVVLADPAAGKRVAAARRDHLRRYGGTPFGELIGKNAVYTFEVRRLPIPKPASGLPPGRTPSESGQTPNPTPRPHPGGSAGGGPASGR